MRIVVTVDLDDLNPWALGLRLSAALGVALLLVAAEVAAVLALLRWLA